MKKTLFQKRKCNLLHKLNLKRKLSFLIMFMTLLTMFANKTNLLRDRLTLDLENISLAKLPSEIENRTDFKLVNTTPIVYLNSNISYKENNEKVTSILDRSFQESRITYKIIKRKIALEKSIKSTTQDRNYESEIGISQIYQFQIVGNISDQDGAPLPGASIVQKGTNNGTQSDFDGNFAITLKDNNGTLVVSYIGFTTQEIPVKGQSKLRIVLEESASSLDEVVVVGYGSQRKVDLTGAVSVVDVEAASRQPTAQVTEQLQGQASGVTVTTSGQPGEAPNVRIRGINTFGNSNPLYVVDGIPTQDISNINPNDVANMQVLKDAGSASIYGARAANGVIIITTKKGAGKITVSYSGYGGIQTPPRGNVYDILSPQEEADLKWVAIQNSNPGEPINDRQYGSGPRPVLPYYILPAGAALGEVDESTYYLDPYYSDPNDMSNFNQIVRANQKGTNWFQEVYGSAPIQSHNISVGQGGDKGNFLFSMNYFDQEGTMKNIFLKRYTARVNSQYNISENFRMGQNFNYSISDGNSGTGTIPIMYNTYRMQSITPVYDIAGNFAGTKAPGTGSGGNPVATSDRLKNNLARTNRLFGNIFAELNLINVFTLRTNFGGDFYNVNSSAFSSPEYENQANEITSTQLTENADTGYNWTWTNTIEYRQNFKNLHDITMLLGSEAYYNQFKKIQAVAKGFYSPNPNFVNLSTGSGTQTNSGFYSEDALFSLFGRLDYTYNNRYIIGATLRRDATSRFTNPRHGWFPSISAGWRISQENFMDNVGWISELKLRGGYGSMGNQVNVDPANAFSTFGSSRTTSFYDISGSNSLITEGFEKIRIGNPDAKWEKNINSNVGIDAVLFNRKLQLTIDYYQKDVKDLLFNPELTATSGAAIAPFINIAEMKNNGLDLSATTYLNITEEFRFNASFNFTSYNNEIVKISGGANNFNQNVSRNGIVRNEVGQPVSQFYGYQIAGFWNSQSEVDEANLRVQEALGQPNAVYQPDIGVGRFRYTDINHDGVITPNDRTFIGNPNPDFTAGLNFGFDYKNFDLNIFLYGVYGKEILNNVKWWNDFYGTFAGAKSKTALYDSWTPTNTNASAPIQETGSNFSTGNEANSYFIEDGSYLRVKNIQFGYSLPDAVLQKSGMQKLRIYLQGTDLFTFTKYSGLDPELTGSPTAFGIDGSAYPYSSMIILGVNFTL